MFTDVVEVVNRRSVPVEQMYDSRPLMWKPFEKKNLPKVIAYNLVQQTALQIDMATGQRSAFMLGITGDPVWPTDPLPGELASHNPIEALDRTNEEEMEETETVVMEGGTPGKVLKEKKPKGRFEAKITGIVEPKGPQGGGSGNANTVTSKGT